MRVPRAEDRLMGDIELVADAVGSDSLFASRSVDHLEDLP